MVSQWIENIRNAENISSYNIKTWEFWRCLLICFALFCMIGHWLEIPYCTFMDMFGIVEEDYSAWTEPWYVPYWVYGIGAVIMTLIIEPLKEYIIKSRKTLWGALIEFYVLAVLLSAVMETLIGILINQPNEMGIYPFWDNSQLPGNILKQGWIVNDMVIGFMAVLYLWVFYPLISKGLRSVKPVVANTIFVVVVILFTAAIVASYGHEWVAFFS